MEGVDNGEDLHCIFISKDASLEYEWDDELLGGIGTIRTSGVRISSSIPDEALYTDDDGCLREKPVEVRLIPYYAWANRGENEMRVWVNE